MAKAQGISINTIIVAAIALIVLVVLVMVFTGRISLFGQGLSDVQEGDACPGTMQQGLICTSGTSQVFNIRTCGEKISRNDTKE